MDKVLDAAFYAADKYISWLGNRFEQTSVILEDAAETFRWLAAVTRATP